MRAYLSTLSLMLTSALLLTGCSFLSPGKSEMKSYLLKATPPPLERGRYRQITILVNPTDGVPVFNKSSMAYSLTPYQIGYFSKNEWAARPADMLYPLIVHTLERMPLFHGVLTSAFQGRYDYVLNSRILELNEDFTHRPVVEKLRVNVQLIEVKTNRVVDTREFSVIEPVYYPNAYGGVLAANRATERFLQELSHYCLKKLR